jgi:Cellulase M and related proteins
MMENIKNLQGLALLEYLCSLFGPTGCEDEVAAKIKEITADICDEVRDIYPGGVLCKINGAKSADGTNKKILFSAHMDEVGFMIKSIDGDGYLKILTVGGIDAKVMCGRRVIVAPWNASSDETKRVRGVIGAKPVHLGGGDSVNVDNMYIDIGATNKEDAEKYVKVGDFAVFDSNFVRFGQDNRMVKGKAIDDRLGCAVMCDIAREMFAIPQNKRPNIDMYFAFTTREEVGLSGALVAANVVNPDYAIVLEATAVADIEGVAKNSQVASQGGGGVLSILDHGTIYNREFFEFALKVGGGKNIPCQVKKFVSGANDAKSIHTSGSGVKTIAVSAPARYIHTASNVIRAEDYGHIKNLVSAIVNELPTAEI